MLPRLIALSLAFPLALGCSEPAPSEGTAEPTPLPGDASDAASDDALDTPGESPDFDRCVPSCEGLACGTDGCGGSCGICASEESCEDGRCVPVCLSHADTVCVDSNVLWIDGCGELEEILETCSTGTECVDGACLPCTPGASLGCVDGAVHWMDSCGNPGALEAECAGDELCADGKCVAGSSPLSGTYALAISPESAAIVHDQGSLTLDLAVESAELLIDGAGDVAWSLVINGSEVAYLGALEAEQLTGAGEFSESVEGVEVLRKSWIQALFLDENSFAGTWTEMVFVGSDPSAPTQIIWELSGERLP